MANNLTAFQSEIQSLFTNTTNLDTATKVEVRDSIVSENRVAYDYWLTSFNPIRLDTNANRSEFVSRWLLMYLKDVVRAARVHAQADVGTIN